MSAASSSFSANIQYQELTPQQQEEQGGDFSVASIQQLFQQTFTDSENEQEGQIVGQLSWDLMDQTPTEDLFIFVATANSTSVVGCIMFSRLIFSEQSDPISFLLAPAAVRTTHQKRGIGQGLLRFAIDEFKKREPKVDLLVTYGDPNYYPKVGFQPVTIAVIPAPLPLSMPQGWLALPLHRKDIQSIPGTSCCVAALNKKELW